MVEALLREAHFEKDRKSRLLRVYGIKENAGEQEAFDYTYAPQPDDLENEVEERMRSGNSMAERNAAYGFYSMLQIMKGQVATILEPVCPGFHGQKDKVALYVNGRSFAVYPHFASYIRPKITDIAAAEKLTKKADDWARRYGSPPLELQMDRILRAGLEVQTADMTLKGLSSLSEIPGIRYKMTVSNAVLADEKERDITVCHELVHTNFELNGATWPAAGAYVGFKRSKLSVEDYLADAETERIMDKCPEIVYPISRMLEPGKSFVLQREKVMPVTF